MSREGEGIALLVFSFSRVHSSWGKGKEGMTPKGALWGALVMRSREAGKGEGIALFIFPLYREEEGTLYVSIATTTCKSEVEHGRQSTSMKDMDMDLPFDVNFVPVV